jgi:hypothetical protein
MTRVVKTRKTRSDIAPERLIVRTVVAWRQSVGRTRVSVEEIAREALSKLMSEHPDRIGTLALAGMKDVVRGELGRSDSTGSPTWISTTVGGEQAREYVHASVASGESLRDTIGYRQDFADALKEKIADLAEILDYTVQHSCTVQDAIFALHPQAEEQEVSVIVEQLEALAA